MTNTNELRVFISSTFRDLQEEREHLVKKIFPEIRAICRKRGITFTEVDLRWGLTDEQLALGQVIRACLEEVDRCRPYFIGITGERYGYVPSFLDIQKDPTLLEQYPWIEDVAMEGRSITEAEAHYAVLGEDVDVEKCENALFYFRRHRESLEDNGEEDRERTLLTEYQDRIRRSGAEIVAFRDPVSLGEQIYDDLIRIIKRDFADATPPTPLEEERMRHEGFSLSRRRAYIANPTYLKALNDHIASSDDPPLVVYAESGSGKSSLFAWFAHQHRKKHPEDHVIEHYVGIGATATDHFAAISHICLEVKERFGREETIPSDPGDLESALGQWLGYAAHELEERDERMVLILDGLNQLPGEAQTLHWLPEEIPSRIRLMLSSTIEETLLELRRRKWKQLGMQALSEAEREAVVVRYLAEYRKALSQEQITKVAGDHKCGHPLFLKTLLEEIRLIGRHEDLDRRLDEYIGATGTEDLFQRMLERLEEDHGARAVRTVLTFLWGTGSGLDERELADITGMARLKIATLVAGLDYHLMRREGRLRFFHDYLRRAVEKRYLGEEGRRKEIHRELADWFARQEPGTRVSRELLRQLQQAGDNDRLAEAMSTIGHFMALNEGATEFELRAAWTEIEASDHLDRYYRRGLEEWRETQPEESDELNVVGAIAGLMAKIGTVEDAIAWHEEWIVLAIEKGNRAQEGEARCMIGFELYRCSRDAEALEQLTFARDICREVGNLSALGYASGNIGNVLYRQGRVDEALEYHRMQEEYCAEAGDQYGVGNALGNLAIIHGHRGEIQEALELFSRQYDIHRSLGNRHGYSMALGNRGINLCRVARYSEGLADLNAAARESGAIGDLHGLSYWFNALAGILLDLIERDGGDVQNGTVPEPLESLLPASTADSWKERALEQAAEWAEKARTISEQRMNHNIHISTEISLVRVSALRRDYDKAEADFHRLIERLDDPTSPWSSGGALMTGSWKADCLLELWKIARAAQYDPEVTEERRLNSLQQFTSLHDEYPQEQFLERIRELNGETLENRK